MASKTPYSGALALATSKHGPRGSMQVPDASRQLVLAAKPSTQDVAIREKAPTTNPDVDLAQSVLEDLNNIVDGECHKFQNGVVQAIANVRRKMELHRQLHPNSPVEDIFTAVDDVFDMLKKDHADRPGFLERVRRALHLWHGSEFVGNMREHPDQMLALQNQVYGLQKIILDHQQVFLDYKASKAAQAKDLHEAQEFATRLSMEKGSLQQELNKSQDDLEAAKSVVDKMKTDQEEARSHIREALQSKNEVEAEVMSLKETVNNLQDKLAAAEQKATDESEGERRRLTEEVAKESAKVVRLEALISTLEKGDTSLKNELKLTKQDNGTLKNKLNVVEEESQASKAKFEKAEEQIANFQKLNRELAEKVSQLTAQNDALEEELENDQKALKDVRAKHEKSKVENLNLVSTIQELQNKAPVSNGVDHLVKQQLAVAEQELAKVTEEMQTWKQLGTQTYEEYRTMLPLYTAAQENEAKLLIKEEECKSALAHINELQDALRAAKTQQAPQPGQTNGSTPAAGNAKYWKDKYELLLQSQIARH